MWIYKCMFVSIYTCTWVHTYCMHIHVYMHACRGQRILLGAKHFLFWDGFFIGMDGQWGPGIHVFTVINTSLFLALGQFFLTNFLLLFLYVNVCTCAFATLPVWVMRIAVIRLGRKVFTCCSILPAIEQHILRKKEKRMWIPTSSHSAARTVFIRSSSTPETTWWFPLISYGICASNLIYESMANGGDVQTRTGTVVNECGPGISSWVCIYKPDSEIGCNYIANCNYIVYVFFNKIQIKK